MTYNEFLKSVLKNVSLMGFISNLSLIFVFVAKNIFIYNWASVNTVEDFTIFLGYIGILITITTFITPVLPKLLSEFEKKKIINLITSVLAIVFLNIFIIFLGLLILFGFGFQFNVSEITDSMFFVILLINVVIISSFNILESLYYGLRNIKKIGLLKFSYSFIFFFLVIIFHIFSILNIYIILIIYLGSYFSSIIIVLAGNLKKNFDKKEIFNFDSNLTKRIINFSYPLLFMKIFYFLNFQVAILILSYVNGVYSVYYYLSTSFIILILGLVGIPLNNINYSYMVELFKEKRVKKMREMYHFMLSIISFLIFGGIIFTYTVSPLLIKLLYNRYYNNTFLLFFKFIIIGGLFHSLNQFLGKIIMAEGSTKINLLGECLGSIANLFFIIFSLIFKNIIFSGYGFIISNVTILVVYLYFSKKYLNLPFIKTKISQIIISSLISLSTYEFIYYFNSFQIINIVISVSIYFLMLILLNVISLKQIREILRMLVAIFKEFFRINIKIN